MQFGWFLQMQPGESLLVKPITRHESGTQTDIHPVETNIVRSYEWNEWELRRKATKLVSLNELMVEAGVVLSRARWGKQRSQNWKSQAEV